MPDGTDAFLVTLNAPATPAETTTDQTGDAGYGYNHGYGYGYGASPPSGLPFAPDAAPARLASRMHKVLRDSAAARLRALLAACARGLLGVGIPSAVAQLSPLAARGRSLDAWGETLGLPRRASESSRDEAYRARVLGPGALAPERSNLAGLELRLADAMAALTPPRGSPVVRDGESFMARFDQLGDAGSEDWLALDQSMDPDFADPGIGLPAGRERYAAEGAYGLGGIVATVPAAFDQGAHDAAVSAFGASCASGAHLHVRFHQRDIPPREDLTGLRWAPASGEALTDGGLLLAAGTLYRRSLPPLARQ